MDVPIPFSPLLEDQTIPDSTAVVKAAHKLMGR
jgi:pyruvate/2-oxoglutarate/acetoin dehydrogenase E1 component